MTQAVAIATPPSPSADCNFPQNRGWQVNWCSSGANGSPRRAAEADRVVFRNVQHPAAQRLDARRDALLRVHQTTIRIFHRPLVKLLAGISGIAMRTCWSP